ncbi:MAG: phospho-sugar mutase, partial [Lachnospiraceae bacterium]|nr:phospho-sugar mutase [Lachnospiraceae bacterium]
MDYKKEYDKWLNANYIDDNSKKILLSMKNDDAKIRECFYDYLSFGTGGMRGIMGVGINRMNIYMVRRATQGLCDFIVENNRDKIVVIAHDSRNNARDYAMEVAKTCIANGIKVYITKGLRPTPFLSYMVRYYKATAGVNITASHNTKEYNGYKLYLSDGAQFSYPDDEKVIAAVNKISDISVCKTISDKDLKKSKLYNEVDSKVEKQFLDDALSKMINNEYIKNNGKNLKIVYTPLHGTGSFFLLDAFKKAGFTNVKVVKSQDDKCGDFKTVPTPNPEKAVAFTESIKIAKQYDSDIIVATDPDADRLGVYVKTGKGKYSALTGNELASVILEYILFFAKKNKYNLRDYFVAKSFVTTRLIDS